MIKPVLLRGEAKQVLALVCDPLPRTFGPEPRQVPFKGPQILLPQISLLLYSHDSVPCPWFTADPTGTPKFLFYQQLALTTRNLSGAVSCSGRGRQGHGVIPRG